jgi:hypothetical protein
MWEASRACGSIHGCALVGLIQETPAKECRDLVHKRYTVGFRGQNAAIVAGEPVEPCLDGSSTLAANFSRNV